MCAINFELEVEQEMIEKTGPNSPGYREVVPSLSTWRASITGLTPIVNDDDHISWFYLLQDAVRRYRQRIQLDWYDDSESPQQARFTGYCYIRLNGISNSAADFSTASIEFIGDGAFQLDLPFEGEFRPVANLAELSDWWQSVDGDNFIEGLSTGNTDGTQYTLSDSSDRILNVTVEGNTFYLVSGTPGNGECKFIGDKIEFASDLIFDGNQRIGVNWERTT